jgi:putative sigma-54 modulation protein
MTVTTTFRHIEATEALKSHSGARVEKLQRFFRQPMAAKVTLSHEKLRHCVEVQIQAGNEWYEAKEECDDMYAAVDLVVQKLERQITHSHGAASAKRRRDVDVRHLDAEPVAATGGDR